MKKLALFVAASSLFAASGSLSAQEASSDEATSGKSLTELQCDSVKTEFAALQDQIPVQIDYMTSITGMSAMMGSEKCLISFSYSFKEDVMIDEVVEGAGGSITEDEAIELLVSEEGRSILKTTLRTQAEAIFEDLGSEAPGMQYNLKYQSDGPNLKPISFMF